MKTIVILAAALLTSTAALANNPAKSGVVSGSTSANVPVGYEVPGCLNYKLVNGKVVEKCADKETPAEFVRSLIDPTSGRGATGGPATQGSND